MKPERLRRSVVHESRWVNLYLDTLRFPDGRVIEGYHVGSPGTELEFAL